MDMVSVTVSVRWLLRGPCRRALFAGHNGSLRNEARLISQGTVTLGRGGDARGDKSMVLFFALLGSGYGLGSGGEQLFLPRP